MDVSTFSYDELCLSAKVFSLEMIGWFKWGNNELFLCSSNA